MPKTAITDGLHRLELNFERLRSSPIELRLWQVPLLTRHVLMTYVDRLTSEQPFWSGSESSKVLTSADSRAFKTNAGRGKAPAPRSLNLAAKYVVLYDRANLVWDGIDPTNPEHLSEGERGSYYSSLHLVESAFYGRFDLLLLDEPPFDEDGNVVIRDENGDILDEDGFVIGSDRMGIDCGSVREVEIAGHADPVNQFLVAADETSHLLDRLPDVIWENRFCDSTRDATIPPLRWLFCVFDLAWAGLDGALLSPTIDRSLVVDERKTETYEPLLEIQDRRGKPDSESQRTDLSHLCPESSPRWFSCLDAAVDASVQAIRVLLADLGCAPDRQIKKGESKSAHDRKKSKVMSKRKNDIIRILGMEGAFDEDARMTASEITNKVSHGSKERGTNKSSLHELVEAGLLDSCRGRDGGYWLTNVGQKYYERLDRPKP